MIEEAFEWEESSVDNKIDCKNNTETSTQFPDINTNMKNQGLPVGGIEAKANHATFPSNGRFQVSRVQSNPQTTIPKYISGKTNGRFTVFKVNSVCEDPNESCSENISETKVTLPKSPEEQHNEPVLSTQNNADIEQNQNCDSKDINQDVQVSHVVNQENPLNKIKEFVDLKFRLPSNFGKRRVTIDGSSVSNVHKIIQQVKSRRKSTPTLGSNNLSGLGHQNRPSLKLTLNKQLECLDLRSTVPLSPGRLVESCGRLHLYL